MQNPHKVTNQRTIFPPALMPDGPLATVFGIGITGSNQLAKRWAYWGKEKAQHPTNTHGHKLAGLVDLKKAHL